MARVIEKGPKLLRKQQQRSALHNAKLLFIRHLEDPDVGRRRDVAKAFVSDLLMRFNRILPETSIQSSLLYGLVPIVARSCATAVGAAIDTACGFATCGFFTLAAAVRSGYLIQEALIEEYERLVGAYQQLAEVIRARQRRALQRINDAVSHFLSNFSSTVQSCPDIGDEGVLKEFVEHLLDHRATRC